MSPPPTAVARTIKQRLLLLACALPLACVAPGCETSGKKADTDAARLSQDVTGATTPMKVLEDKLVEGQMKLQAKTFPDKLAAVVGSIHLRFDATTLSGKRFDHLPTRVLTALLSFNAGTEQLNRSKDRLKKLLETAEAPLVKAWKDEKEPTASFAVIFRADGGKTVGELVSIKEPFLLAGEHPASFDIVEHEGTKLTEKKASRWVRGPLVGAESVAVPLDPRTTAAFSTDVTAQRLIKVLRDMRELLAGPLDEPTKSEPGLIKLGEDLAHDLQKASMGELEG